MKKKKFSELVIIILIFLFFCTLAFNESVTQWPGSTGFAYNFLLK